ncbi:hypothetical protein NQZ79_g1632 [Umbelopsis isabellina]|nr:hypothetical protein NQZ79_g1632 [Umbelopsis isabellina]
MSNHNSAADVAVLACLSPQDPVGYEADTSSLGFRSLDTVSTSQGGYSADLEEKFTTVRVNPNFTIRQKSSQTIFASDDEEDEHWSLILAEIEGHRDKSSQATITYKQEETNPTHLLHDAQTNADHSNDHPSPAVSDWGSPLSERRPSTASVETNKDSNGTLATGKYNSQKSVIAEEEELDETQTYSIHDSLEDAGVAETQVYSIHDPLEERSLEETQAYSIHDPLSMEESPLDEPSALEPSVKESAVAETQVYSIHDPIILEESSLRTPPMEEPISNELAVAETQVYSIHDPLDAMDETQTYSVHDPLEEHEESHVFNRTKNDDAAEAETQVYDIYDPLSQEEEVDHVMVPATIDHSEPLNDLHDASDSHLSGRQQSTLSMTWTMADMNFTEVGNKKASSHGLRANYGGAKAIVNNSYILYEATQSLHSSPHVNEPLLDDIHYVETSDTEEMNEPISSPNKTAHNPYSRRERLKAAKDIASSQATIIRSPIPSSMNEVLDEPILGSQGSQQSASTSSGRLSFDRVVKSPMKDMRKRAQVAEANQPHRVPKRRPVLGLAKPQQHTSVLRAVKTTSSNTPTKSIHTTASKPIKRLYGVNSRRKPTR